MMNKEDYTPEELLKTAEAIRSATLPKSITPEMVGGTMLGILSLLGGKASDSGALESVQPRLTARSGFIKLSLDLTKADGSTDTETAYVNLPAATASLAGLMTSVQVQKLALLDKVLLELTGIGDERSLEIYTGWNPEVTDMWAMFENDVDVVYFPKVDTSKVKQISYAFTGCPNFKYLATIDTSNCTRMQGSFLGTAMETFPPINTSKVVIMEWMFAESALTHMDAIDSANNTNTGHMFADCQKLTKVADMDMTNVWHSKWMFLNCPKLVYARLRNLGAVSNMLAADTFLNAPAWGSGGEENRQSLVDSLLTYSFDRAAAGYAALAFQLEPEVLARLTDEEIAAITAKGFTLTSY